MASRSASPGPTCRSFKDTNPYFLFHFKVTPALDFEERIVPISMQCPSCNKTLSAGHRRGQEGQVPCLRDCDGYPHRRIRGRRDRRSVGQAPEPSPPSEHNMLDDILSTPPLQQPGESVGAAAGTPTPALSHVRRNDHGRGCQVPILRCRFRSPTPGSFVAWRPKLFGVHDCGSGGAHQADQESLHGLVVVPCSRDWSDHRRRHHRLRDPPLASHRRPGAIVGFLVILSWNCVLDSAYKSWCIFQDWRRPRRDWQSV